MAEFRLAVGQISCPDISREEIVNACGVDDAHDGVDYVRTACVIAAARAREVFEPFVHQLGYRLAHVLRRLLPVAMFLLEVGEGRGWGRGGQGQVRGGLGRARSEQPRQRPPKTVTSLDKHRSIAPIANKTDGAAARRQVPRRPRPLPAARRRGVPRLPRQRGGGVPRQVPRGPAVDDALRDVVRVLTLVGRLGAGLDDLGLC